MIIAIIRFRHLQDGSICSFDLQSNNVVARIQLADKDAAVPSISMDPNNEDLAYCCSGSDIFMIDQRKVLPLLN